MGVDAPGVVDAATAELTPCELPPDQVVSGSPVVSALVLATSADGRVERGIWEITPGVVVDVEGDELFVVIAGRATVEIVGGPSLQLAPGVAGLLRAGDRTTWHVHETLRKVYQLTV